MSNAFNSEWTYKNRQKYLEKIENETFDLIIIGGGITGAGIAREAALRGIKAVIFDKNDFAFGTSSRSSKMAHGGARYLMQGQFRIVRESTTERNWLRSHFPNLLRPITFNICIYNGTQRKFSMLGKGIALYDFISNFRSKFKTLKKCKTLKREESTKEEPELRKDGLIGMCQFYSDNHVDDSRLTIETIKESIVLGDLIALNYTEVKDYIIEGQKIIGVKVKDILGDKDYKVKGSAIVNATGIWTDTMLRNHPNKVIRPTKGVHVVIRNERLGNRNSFGVKSIDDNRGFFIIKREEYTIIGTTDTDYEGDLDNPWCCKEDCDYLFNTVNYLFPNAHLTYNDIISTYAGVRPLVMEVGKSESEISRKHIIFDTQDGLVSVAGGKLTIFRKMGEDVIYHLIKERGTIKRKFTTEQLKKDYSKKPFLIGLERNQWDSFVREKKIDLSEDVLNHLYWQYGKGAREIIESIAKNPNLGKKFVPENCFIPAEICYVLKYEFAPHLIDVMIRRTEIQMKVHYSKQLDVAKKVAQIMAEEYQWNNETKEKEINYYMNYIKNTVWF